VEDSVAEDNAANAAKTVDTDLATMSVADEEQIVW